MNLILQGNGAILLAALLWSTGGLFIKMAPLSGPLVCFGRAVITSLFYLIVLRPNLRRASWPTALAYAGMITSFVVSVKLTTAANAILLQYTGTAWMIALAPRVLGEPIQAVDLWAGLACLLGMFLCLGTGLDWQAGLHGDALPGNLLAAFSGFCYAGAVLGMRRDARHGKHGDAQASVTLGNLLAMVFSLALVREPMIHLAQPRAIFALLWLGIVQMALAYLLFLRGLRTVSAATAGLLALLEPAATPIWVWMGIGEKPGIGSILGGSLVLVALGARAWWLGQPRQGSLEA